MLKTFVAAGSFVLLVAGAAAPISAAEADSPQKVEAEMTTKVICRRMQAIGTRLASKRVCRTKADWDAEAAANRLDLERSQTQRWKSD
jgi:hypothetical protein